jgi:flagellar capping protein FliD
MAEEKTEATQDPTSTTEVAKGVDASVETTQVSDDVTETTADAQAASEQVAETDGSIEVSPEQTPEAAAAQDASVETTEPEPPKEPDAIQPFIDKACETIQHEVDDAEVNKFLRAHIKTFREEWDAMSDTAKDAYLHMMTSQLLQRKASTTRIMLYEEFKLPVPSAQTKLFESIKQSQIKPKKCIPVLLMPPNLRPAYVLKK